VVIASSSTRFRWGVCVETVRSWRRALGVPAQTVGSARLRQHYITIGWETSGSPESRAKMSAAHAYRPDCPQFREAARDAARRPKSEAWMKAQSERMKREWASGVRRNPFGRGRETE